MYLYNITDNFYVQDNLLKLIYKGAGDCKLCKYLIMHGKYNIRFFKMGLLSFAWVLR